MPGPTAPLNACLLRASLEGHGGFSPGSRGQGTQEGSFTQTCTCPIPPPKDPPSRLPLGHQGWCLRAVVFTLHNLLRPSYFPLLPAKIVHPEHTRSPTCVSLRGEDGLLAGWPGSSWTDVGPVGNQGSKSNGVGKVAPREGPSREVHGILPSGQPFQAQSHGFWTFGF